MRWFASNASCDMAICPKPLARRTLPRVRKDVSLRAARKVPEIADNDEILRCLRVSLAALVDFAFAASLRLHPEFVRNV